MRTHLGMCIAHPGAHVFASAGKKCYQHTDTLLDVQLKKIGNTLADIITQTPFYAVADRLAGVEAETLGDKTGRFESRGTTSCFGCHGRRGWG